MCQPAVTLRVSKIMKILSGKFKGRNFYMPEGIRPTQNLVRKALFDVIGDELLGCDFLDLFAGSGAVGLEALSNGAKSACFVEADPKCVEVITANIILLDLIAHVKQGLMYTVIHAEAFASIKQIVRRGNKYDIIFVDPPYGRELGKKILKTLEAYDIVRTNCLIIIEHEKSEKLPEVSGKFFRNEQRKYGASVLSFYRLRSN